MKKCFVLNIFILVSLFSVSAQNIVSKMIDRYGDDDNFEVVTIGKKMINKMRSSEKGNAGFLQAINGLTSINVLSSKNRDIGNEYYNSARELMTRGNKGYKEMSPAEGGKEKTVVFINKGKIKEKGKVQELVLLSKNEQKAFEMIVFYGNINIQSLIKYSDHINLNDGIKRKKKR